MKALALAIGMTAIAAADDLRLTVHMVAMEQGKLTVLLDEPGGLSIAKAREMVKEGEARLFDTMMLRGKREERASIQSVREVIFPAEEEAPEGLDYTPEGMEKFQARMEKWRKVFPFMPVMANGTYFETREVGETLLWLSDSYGGSRWILELDAYVRDTVYLELPALDGKRFKWSYPEFEKLAINGHLQQHAWQCVGILTKPGEDGGPGEKIVVFARLERLKFGE